jgi:hypothetical protein
MTIHGAHAGALGVIELLQHAFALRQLEVIDPASQ